MEVAGHEPPVALLEACLARAERHGDEAAIKRLMDALELQAYKIIGAAAKASPGHRALWQVSGWLRTVIAAIRRPLRQLYASNGGSSRPTPWQGPDFDGQDWLHGLM